MSFEEILPKLKAGKIVIRKGWGRGELYVKPGGEVTHSPKLTFVAPYKKLCYYLDIELLDV